MIICFDLETTGLDRYNDKIIEIAMIKFDEKTFKIVDKFSSFVNPEIEIPEIISNITNIFNESVDTAPKIEDLRTEITDFIGGLPLLGHNISFDVDFFINNGINIKNNIHIDTFFLANILCFKEPSLNLEMLCNSFGIGFIGAHRAINDAEATIRLFEKLKNKFDTLDKEKKHLLYYIFNKSEGKDINFLREFLFNNIDSNLSFNDFEDKILKIIGKYNKERKIIIDNNIDNKNMSNLFGLLNNVERRDNQLKMTNLIMDSFNKEKKVIIEAPTGLGKSFAYLLPSIINSLKTGEKVFISTKTKALQDQLYEKDLKYLSKNLGFDFNYSKLKGKKNYISIKLFFDEFWLGHLNYTKIGFLSKILLWIYETEFGELDELNYFGDEFSYLRFINSDNFTVGSEKNNYKDYEYLIKARRDLEISNVVVINHSLLFSDINSKTGILGKFYNLIIDEGHNIEDSVTDSLRKKYTLKGLQDTFGLIEKILDKIESKKIDFLKLKESLISKLEILDDYLFSYIDSKILDNNSYKTLLQKNNFFDDTDFSGIVSKIELDFIDIIDILSTNNEYNFSKETGILQNNLDIVKIILDKDNNNKFIKIINYNLKYGINFEYTLLNPGKYLKENLWDKLKTCVITSATLQIAGKFDYFEKLLFLDDFEFAIFESDFDYKKQSTLFIPTDLGNIKSNSGEVILFLKDFFSIVGGRVLTLLTSYNIIKKIYNGINMDLRSKGINLYAQGIAGSKIKLLNFFLNDSKNSILLGTDSFWEGVDIPGDDLKYLVIHKFPFPVPTDPIFEARSSFFKDSFSEYSVPKAIIKLKQGFGRLIRTKNDKGIVILLDDRIINTSWGKVFLEAFPSDINIKKGTKKNFLDILSIK